MLWRIDRNARCVVILINAGDEESSKSLFAVIANVDCLLVCRYFNQ